MSGLRTCVVVLCGAMANVAIASPKIEARGELGKLIGGGVGGFVGDKIWRSNWGSWRSSGYWIREISW